MVKKPFHLISYKSHQERFDFISDIFGDLRYLGTWSLSSADIKHSIVYLKYWYIILNMAVFVNFGKVFFGKVY